MSKHAIVYVSKTGNTKKIAEAFASVKPEAFDLFDVNDNPDLTNYDLVIFGFGVDKGAPYASCQQFMKTIQNKTVILFFTMGAEPDGEHAMCCAANGGAWLGEGNHVIGTFASQGAIDPKLIEMMRKMPAGGPHSATPENEARWAAASTHPDEADIARAKAFMEGKLHLYDRFYQMMKKGK